MGSKDKDDVDVDVPHVTHDDEESFKRVIQNQQQQNLSAVHNNKAISSDTAAGFIAHTCDYR